MVFLVGKQKSKIQDVEEEGGGGYTAKTQQRKLETNIPRKGIARHPSPYFHIHVSVRDLYILTNWSAYSATGKYVDRSWKYINRSQSN